jgi:hypothetical protein
MVHCWHWQIILQEKRGIESMGTNRSGTRRYARIRRAKKNLETRERAQKKTETAKRPSP